MCVYLYTCMFIVNETSQSISRQTRCTCAPRGHFSPTHTHTNPFEKVHLSHDHQNISINLSTCILDLHQ